jgi:hypothetical protein
MKKYKVTESMTGMPQIEFILDEKQVERFACYPGMTEEQKRVAVQHWLTKKNAIEIEEEKQEDG